MIYLPHLETNISIACQLRCVSCNHFVALQADQFKSLMMPIEVLKRDLSIFSKVCHVEAYAMIGGEPTLHPKITELLQVARDSGVADELQVWTNGIGLLSRLPEGHQFWQSFDRLVLSRYPGKLSNEEVSQIANVCGRSGVQIRLMDEAKSPNWTRLLESTPADDQYSQLKYSQCWFKTYCRVLDWGYFGRCCTSPFIPKLLQGREFGSDMLRVDEGLTEEQLRAYLDAPRFMESCRICAGRETPSAVRVVWSEEREPEKWLEMSQGLGLGLGPT